MTEREPGASGGWWVLPGLGGLIVMAGLVLAVVGRRDDRPPTTIVGDPVLVEGRAVYRARCLSCHGETGRGDGPIAKGLHGPPVGDLTDGRWKHGEQPDQVRRVVERGVRDTAMPGWKGMIADRQIDAALAYVFHLAGRRRRPALDATHTLPATESTTP